MIDMLSPRMIMDGFPSDEMLSTLTFIDSPDVLTDSNPRLMMTGRALAQGIENSYRTSFPSKASARLYTFSTSCSHRYTFLKNAQNLLDLCFTLVSGESLFHSLNNAREGKLMIILGCLYTGSIGRYEGIRS